MAIALRDTTALKTGGLISLAREFEGQSPQAPLVPLATVPFDAVFGNGVFQSLLALQAFAAALIFVTYELARTFLDKGWALLAAACAGTIPGVADYSRLYAFAVPAAVFLTACALALIRSNRLRRRGWVVVAGVMAGLMLLSRTMTVAFLPGVALAAIGLLAAAPRGDRLRRGFSLVLAASVTFSLAATWYLRNFLSVAAYLFGYGYGKQSASFGESHSPSSWGYWTKDLRLAAESLYVPLAAVIALALAVALAQRFRSRALKLSSFGTPTLVIAVLEIGGYLALTSSKNEGTGFILPLIPGLAVLGVGAVAGLRASMVRSGLATLFVIICACNLVMKSGYVPLLADPRTATVPGMGSLPVVDGRGLIQREVATDGFSIDPVTEPMPDLHKRWLPLMRRLGSFMVRYASARGQTPYIVFGSDDAIFNVTRFDLVDALWLKSGTRWGFVEIPGSDSVGYYRARLEALEPNFVEMAGHARRSDHLRITQRYVMIAAKSLGYERVYRFRLPDGRFASLWYRRQPTLISSFAPRRRIVASRGVNAGYWFASSVATRSGGFIR